MSLVFQYNLVLHIIFGVMGVIALYAVWMALLRAKPSFKFLRVSSISAFVFLVLSWITGGYYYSKYYGTEVKPVIKEGQYPWAHDIFMESKEHVFLFLPFLAFVLAVAIFLLRDQLTSESKLKRALIFLAGLSFLLGVAITLSGVVISGAVR